MSEEVEFLVCLNCDTPCYSFEYEERKGIVSAFCSVCGNDEAKEFRLPTDDEIEAALARNNGRAGGAPPRPPPPPPATNPPPRAATPRPRCRGCSRRGRS